VFTLATITGIAGATYAKAFESEWLEYTEKECQIPSLGGTVDIVHLSDFHACSDVPNSLIERAIQMAAAARPDLICVTGDFVTKYRSVDATWYANALRCLAETAPTFAVLGNHDIGSRFSDSVEYPTRSGILDILKTAGITLLHNRSQKFVTTAGVTLQLTGVGDLLTREIDGAEAFSSGSLDHPTVLLSHNPDSKDAVARYAWDLMLCGHTHGGQVVAPIVGISPAPVHDRRYIAGMKRWRDRWIHVSRGVGSIGGFRFNCRPEVTRVRLLPEPPSIT